MSQNSPIHSAQVDEDASFYLARIRQIDKIIEGPVKTLIGLTRRPQKGSRRTSRKNQLYFPTWISSELKPELEDNRLTQAICTGTLQRVWRIRRRFQWLDKQSLGQLRKDREELLAKSFAPRVQDDFYECASVLDSKIFGGLNPLTASQVFRILLDEGEHYAHSGIGFLTFFAMIWPLSRSFPNRLTVGARIEPWEVTAYVTAKCLLPIRTLQGIIGRRAQLYDDIATNLRKLAENIDEDNPNDRWRFKIELDDLSANVSHLSLLAIDKEAFADCAKSIVKLSGRSDLDNKAVYARVLRNFRTALKRIRTRSRQVLKNAEAIVERIDELIKKPLVQREKLVTRIARQRRTKRRSRSNGPLDQQFNDSLTKTLNLRFAAEHVDNPEYWKDLADAAKKSIEYCKRALEELAAAGELTLEIRGKKASNDSVKLGKLIFKALADLASANRSVKEVLNQPVHHAALWCRSVVDREIAHASAENFTDFDPSELVSAIAVGVGWNLMSTQLQVSDAVTKAIAGARKDGSWRSGKPYYSSNHATGVWAMTSDLVWTLASAIEHFPGVREADSELFNFVNWLERTQVSLPSKSISSASEGEHAGSRTAPDHMSADYIGWHSERLRDHQKIHLGTTALSINALLEVRDLAEYRLWELCKKRFAVVSSDKPLREIDPVDLGAAHTKRLHRRLEQMAYRAKINHEDAEYSLVLHGPPGSSKTKLAEALSTDMWKFSNRWGPRETRLIRITPADFTRMGEDRLDSEARAIFDLISGVRAVTIFFDEIDDLLRQRNTGNERPTFMELVVPAMLNRLADLRSACPRQELSFILATNYVENIDSALIRKGRIDASIPVVYPDFVSRVAIIISEIRRNVKKEEFREESEALKKKVRAFLLRPARCETIADETGMWPYLALTSLCGYLTRELIKNPDSVFGSVLEQGIAEYGSSFSPPVYTQRFKRDSQELLNEYCHHIISQPKEWRDCDAVLKKTHNFGELDTRVQEKLEKLLATVLLKEERKRSKKAATLTT